MTKIKAENSTILFGSQVYDSLNLYLKKSQFSKIFLIVDSNTHQFCLPIFLSKVETNLDIEIIEIPDGEINKTIEICAGVWQTLADYNADRKSLIINLGGGVVTDLGGFVSSTYMRGITFVNVPTTLLSMVDASVGGKTGVDLGVLKNLVGVFSDAELVLIDSEYLKTLPYKQLVSGFAEMLKHGLISDKNYWNELKNLNKISIVNVASYIYKSVELKHNVVKEDVKESGLRKILNFGHTLGHAIESYFLANSKKPTLFHGEAIAAGMIMEAFISFSKAYISNSELNEITLSINTFFEKVSIEEDDINPIINLLQYDKKNSHGNINFVLLNEIGSAKIDCKVDISTIIKAIDFYNKS